MKDMYSSTDDEGVASMVYLMCPSEGLPGPTLVTHIYTRPDIRGNHHARNLFNAVLMQADSEGVTLLLVIDPDPEDQDQKNLSYVQLHSWYHRCGFRYYLDPQGTYQDPTMVRYPGAERVYDI